MPAINKKDSRFKLQFLPNNDHSIQAGLVAVEAMARRMSATSGKAGGLR